MAKKKKWKQQGKKSAAVERQTASRAAAGSPKAAAGQGTAAKLMNRWRTAICLAVIALLGILIYANTFSVPFVFDDQANIVNNDGVRDLHGLINGSGFQRFVGMLSFMANYRLNGFDVTGYHIFNLTVHLLNALMVFALISLTLRMPVFRKLRTGESGALNPATVIPLFAALIFVAHPIQTQAVTYIVQRLASLATFFYLLALLAYIKSRLLSRAGGLDAEEDHGPGLNSRASDRNSILRIPLVGRISRSRGFFYGVALVSAVLAAGTKEIAFTLPAVLALWEFSFCAGELKKRITRLLPFLAVMVIVPLSHVSGNSTMLEVKGELPPPPAQEYLMTQFRVIVTYLRLLVFPQGQNLDYDYPIYNSLSNLNVFISLLFLLLIAAGGIMCYFYSSRQRGRPLLWLTGFGIFWFFITLSVESSVIRIPDLIFEHRLYLPSIGFIIATVSGLEIAAMVVAKRIPWINKALVVFLALVVGIFAAATLSRNNVWRQNITIWEDTVSKSPGKARPHNNLGTLYQANGELDRAEEQFRLAITSRPDYPEAHNNLGFVYELRGEPDKAEAEYNLALASKPDYAEAHNNLGIAFSNRGELDRAEAEYNLALASKPDYAEAHYNLGILYNQRGEFNKAEVEYRLALANSPDYENAWFNLGMNYLDEKSPGEAVAALKKAVEIKPDDFEAHLFLGNAYAGQGSFDKAIVEYNTAIKIKPDYQEAKDNILKVQQMMAGS